MIPYKIIRRLELNKLCAAVDTFNTINRKNSSVPTPNIAKINALQKVSVDVSDIAPYFPKSFNLAAYINGSETLKKLLHLNVDLNKIEKKPHIVEKLLKLDFEKDIKQIIVFLKEYVDIKEIGYLVTKNPLILNETLDDLEVRINYLQSKQFSRDQINRIVLKNPFWLLFSTLRIDRRLGYFQKKFSLCGNEVRFLTIRQPKIITYNLQHINTNSFVIKEEMGFNDNEIKQLLLHQPKLWMICQRRLHERFNYLHNIIKIPHSDIVLNPNILLCRNFKIKQRHVFLQKLGRAQFDPTKENYVPIMALAKDSDIEFCKNYAKCNIDEFNIFLKTL